MLEQRNSLSPVSGEQLMCWVHFFPVSDLSTTTSLSEHSGVEWFISTSTGVRKVAGVSWRILVASPSPSLRGGGLSTASSLSWRQVTRTGCSAARGGITILSPELRLPVIAPPRASTRKLTRNSALVGLLSASASPVRPRSPLWDLRVMAEAPAARSHTQPSKNTDKISI